MRTGTPRISIGSAINTLIRYGVLIAIALSFPGAMITAASSQEQSTNTSAAFRDLKEIIAEGRLRIAFTGFDLPGFRTKGADGSFVGPEAELATDLAKKLNLKLVHVNGGPTFNSLAKTVADGNADIGISRMSASFDRAPYVRFSQPYAKLRHAMVYNRAVVARLAMGGNPEDAVRSFTGRIGAIEASSYVEFAEANFPNATIVGVKSWDAGVLALKEGKVDAIYRDEFEVRRVLERNPDMGVAFGSAIFTDKVDLKVVYICNSCANLQQLVNLYIEINQESLARAMSANALLKNARERP